MLVLEIGHERCKIRVDIMDTFERTDEADVSIWANDNNRTCRLDAERFIRFTALLPIHVKVINKNSAK